MLLVFLVALTGAGRAGAQSAGNQSIIGPITGDVIPFRVYLPSSYSTESARRFPVIYHLHGAGANYTSGTSTLETVYGGYMAGGQMPEAIIVFPDGKIDSFWADSFDGEKMVETNVIRELIPHIDATYRTLADREHRVVQGFSMGGFGAMEYASKFPTLFGAAVGLDGALTLWADLMRLHPEITSGIFNNDESYFNHYSPYSNAPLNQSALLGLTTQFFVLVGQLMQDNQNWMDRLDALGIPYQYHDSTCQHSFSCITGNTVDMDAVAAFLDAYLAGDTTPSAVANISNWKLHTGTTTYGGMTWGEIQRSGDADPRTDTSVLDTWTWIWGQEEGLNSGRSQTGVSAFMNGIELDNGAAFRAEMRAKADALIAAMKAKNNGHKVYWQIGNEINSRHFGHGSQNDTSTDNFGTMRDWAVSRGYAYPHPLTPQDGPGGTSDGRNDRGYIPYFIEYFMAPTIQAIMEANAAEPNADFHVKIMTGSIANADNVAAQDNWVPAFLDYMIQGTYCGVGSPLIGKTVKGVVDLLSIHYLMKGQGQLILDDYYDTWVSPFATGSTITGIITTEEIGVSAADNGFGAMLAMQVFSRYADVWLSRGFTHEQGALCFYGTNNASTANITSCKADYAMTKLAEFLPSATSSFSAYVDIVNTNSSLALETIGFKNQNDSKRVLFLSPMSTSAHTLSLATMAGSGWTGTDATVTARVFTTGGETIPAATITRNASTGNYDIALSPAVDMSTSNKVVMLYATTPTANATTPPPPAPTGFTATAGNAQVALSWTASSGTTSYKVKRSTASGGSYTTITSPTGTSHTDTTVANGTTYYYVVSAVNAGGESANSAQASATPQATPPPAPPPSTGGGGGGGAFSPWFIAALGLLILLRQRFHPTTIR